MPTPLYCADDARAADQHAIQSLGLDACELMQRAGAASFALLRARWPRARRIGVLCGPGNNGGDGYVLARLARAIGLGVQVWMLPGGEPRSAEARQVHADWLAAGGSVAEFDGPLPACDLYVDALFGTGLTRAPSAAAAAAIAALNAQSAPVFALDLPSGLDADRGSAPGDCVRAAVTLGFILDKRGAFTGIGPAVCGERLLAGLDLPVGIAAAQTPRARRYREADLAEFLAPRARDAHKGSFGHVLAIGGEVGMAGALALCAQAAMRSGAGMLTAATRAASAAVVQGDRAEMMVRAVDDPEALAPLLERASVIVAGPGLGRSTWAEALLASVLSSDRARVLDADALNLLATVPQPVGDAIITPHPGEAARLLGCSVAQIEHDRFAAAAALVERHACVVVLKGAGTLVAGPGRTCALIDAGNPGMATAGMGDVLAGVIAGLRAQGLAAFDAAVCGALAHAVAGDRAAADGGERGLLAGDVLAQLRATVNPA